MFWKESIKKKSLSDFRHGEVCLRGSIPRPCHRIIRMNIEDAIYYLEEIKSDMDENCNEYIDAISMAIDALKTLKAIEI